MPETLVVNEPMLFALLYCSVLGVVVSWEGLAPRRALSAPLRKRWLNTLALYGLDMVLLRFLFPLLGVGVAIVARENGIGIFNAWETPGALAAPVSFLLIDAGHYLQHFLLHHIPPLWRLHRMHHTDLDYDFSTGLRFHPLESFFTTAANLGIIAVLGAPPAAVVVYELIHVVIAVGVHGNVRYPVSVDRVARLFTITPDMHRVHHSAAVRETNSNFGAVLPWWDRALGTYVAQPEQGHEGMSIGLPEFRDPKHLGLGWMLVNPFLPVSREEESPHTTWDAVRVRES